jgi:hypothetical protein
MKNYLIPNLTAGQVKALQAAGLQCYIFDDSNQSFIVESENLALVQQLLKARAKTSPSQFENIISVELEYYAVVQENLVPVEGTNVTVEANGSELPKAKFVKLIDEVLGPIVGSKIVLHLPPRGDNQKRARAPFYDDYFHIHIWSAPRGKRRFTPPEKIWDIAVDNRNKCFGSTGQGIPLLEKASEYAVGEIVAKNLYVFHNLLSDYSKTELALLGAILQKASRDLNLSPAETAHRSRERRKEGLSKSRKNYVKICSERVKKMVKAAQSSYTSTAKALPPLQNALMHMLRLDAFSAPAGTEAEAMAARRATFAAEFESLRQVPRIKSVTARHNLVYLKTEALCARHPQSGQMHEVGEFLIVIDLQGGPAPVRWYNSSRRLDAVRTRMNAPNVYANGTPMVDEIQETLLELIARLELSIVAELAIQFIETATDNIPFNHLDKWPLAASPN